MVNSKYDNIYKWVYRDALGDQGACRREGCQEQLESTEHAVCGCAWAQERWDKLEAELTMEWDLKEWGDWKEISWLSNKYVGWKRLWTAAGAVPRDIELKIGSEFSPQVHSRIIQAANRCAKTAEKIWSERNENNEAWIDSLPELRARKTKAARQQWKWESQPTIRVPKKRNRVQQMEDARDEHRKEARIRVDESMEGWENTTNEEREESQLLRVSPEELLMVTNLERAAADKAVVAAHKGTIGRARKAGSTPDIDTGNAMLVDMIDTVQVLSGKRTRGLDAHFWVPVKGASVMVFWAGVDGLGVHLKVPGTWHPATVSNMEWPEDKGEPGLYLKYAADGLEEWTAMSLFGDTVLPIETTKKMKPNVNDRKRKQDCVEYTEQFPREATEWLGYGATLKVKWGARGPTHKRMQDKGV